MNKEQIKARLARAIEKENAAYNEALASDPTDFDYQADQDRFHDCAEAVYCLRQRLAVVD